MSAPALSRGLEIIELLNKEGALSLDEISRMLDVPKSSLIRLLNVLCEKGFVIRQNNEYKPIANIVRQNTGEEYFQARLSAVLEKLAIEAQATAEWFVPNDRGLVLASRFAPPDIEVFVRARIGFLRQWNEEFDSVAQNGYALWKDAPSPCAGQLWRYDDRGNKTNLEDGKIREILASIGNISPVRDLSCNSNGVIRISVGISIQNNLKGILALALPCIPAITNQLEEKEKILVGHAKSLLS